VAITPALTPIFKKRPAAATRAAEKDSGFGEFIRVERQPMHIYALPLHNNAKPAGVLALYHDTTYIDVQLSHTLRDALLTALIQTLLITALAMVLVRWTFTNPLARTAKWLRTLRTGQSHTPPTLPEGEIFDQLHHEVTHLARDLNAARASAEKEARLRDTNASQWTSERLRVSLRNKLKGQPLFVVSNREPYMHVLNENRSVSVIVPASGLVTALEPVLLACDGTWIRMIACASRRTGRVIRCGEYG
jgi:trehalose 6-phosphate synthase